MVLKLPEGLIQTQIVGVACSSEAECFSLPETVVLVPSTTKAATSTTQELAVQSTCRFQIQLSLRQSPKIFIAIMLSVMEMLMLPVQNAHCENHGHGVWGGGY